jgi:hypothetical protein
VPNNCPVGTGIVIVVNGHDFTGISKAKIDVYEVPFEFISDIVIKITVPSTINEGVYAIGVERRQGNLLAAATNNGMHFDAMSK